MNAERQFSLSVDDREIRGVIHPAHLPGKRPVVVVCHGFKGFMDWGFFPFLAELLASRGFCAIRFNFSGSGMRPGDELVTDLPAFASATFSRDLAELVALIGAVETLAPEEADPRRIGLLGHSRGGGTALLAAAEHSAVRTLVTWAAVSTFARLPPEAVEQWRTVGETPVVNARTGQQLALERVVLEDLERNAARLDLAAAAGRRTAPWLILHGSADQTVPFAEAETLRSAATPPVELHRIDGGDHTFGAKHPFPGPNPHLTEAMNVTQLWLRRHLGS